MGEKPRELNDQEIEQQEAIAEGKRQDEELRQAVEGNFGKEALSNAEYLGKHMDITIKKHLLSKENQKGAEEALDVWREFVNRLQTRLMAENLKNPEMVETVLKMATALIQPEPNKEGEDAVREGMRIVKSRYSGIEK